MEHDIGQVLYLAEGDDLIRLDFGYDEVILEANRDGFRSLAVTMLQFDSDTVRDFTDIHFYPDVSLSHDSLYFSMQLIPDPQPVETAEPSEDRPFTTSEDGLVQFEPEPGTYIEVELMSNDIYIFANRRGFRSLARAFRQFDDDRAREATQIHLRPKIDLAPQSTALTIQLTSASWFDYQALCFGHSPEEIEAIRTWDPQEQAKWEQQIVREITDQVHHRGRFAIDGRPSSLAGGR